MLSPQFDSPILVLATLLQACGPHAAPTKPTALEKYFAGQVVDSAGAPASGAVLIISDAVTGDLLSTVHAGSDGRFVTSLRRGAYALTATDNEQSVYVPSADGKHGPVAIRLDTHCHRFEGRIRARSSFPENAIVRLTRMSDDIGDVFGAVVAPNGAFHACIPAAGYFVYPPEGFASRNAMAVIPYPRVFDYHTEAQQDTDQSAASMSGFRPESREAFVAALPASTKVLGLGETNHGTREFYDERTALVTSLASKRGIRFLMIEAGYGEVLPLDDYVNGAEVDVARAVQELGYWTWDTKTFLRSLAGIRAYNAGLPLDQRIRLFGFDVQNTSGAIKYLEQGRPALLSAEQRLMLEPLAADDGKAWPTLPPAERRAIRTTLGSIAAAREIGSATSSTNRAALAARSLLLHFDLLEAKEPEHARDVRDAGMARMVVEILAAEPSSRATLWAHLGHLARENVVGLRPMGAHLAAALGAGYRVYGLLAVAGSARAWDDKLEIGVIAKPLATPPAYSLEAALEAHSSGTPVTYWTFAQATDEAAHWLEGIHLVRQFGAVFMPEGQEFAYWDLQSFDGAILFESVSPTVPTPTGERRAKPKPQ